MPTVRLREITEYPEETQKLFETAKSWFRYDFKQPPAMSRVMAWDPEFGSAHSRAMKRAAAPGEFTRAEKEMVAAVVSGVNACDYWVQAHTAAGKLQGLKTDAPWYEAAYVVGITNALNVVADGLASLPGREPLIAPLDEANADSKTLAVFAEIRSFYDRTDVPLPFRLLAHDSCYLGDLWEAVRRVFTDNRLSRRLKESLAFAVSLTTRSNFGTEFHLTEMRRLGISESGIREVLGVTQMFSSYTKIADTLQLEPDMGDMAPVDWSPAPGGAPR